MGITLETLALIKVQCALRKTTLVIVPNEIDRLHYQRIMKDWPEEHRALVTIRTSSKHHPRSGASHTRNLLRWYA